MALFLKAKHGIYQLFENKDGEPLQQLPAHVFSDTGDMCVLWQDVQNAFHGVDYVEEVNSDNSDRILFVVDQYGDVFRPLRIWIHNVAPYRVIYRDHQGQLPPELEIQYLYRSWTDAVKNMKPERTRYIPSFHRISGNAEYHLSKLLKHLELMREIGVKIEVDGKSEDQILDEIREYQQKASVCEYQSASREIMDSSDSPTPCQFLVLPADLSSWKDSDPTTHQFRLYFLCHTIPDATNQTGIPQHSHLSNHPGYKLDRPQEFFQAFGGLTLTMLKMVRQGASHRYSKIPPLDTFEILWNFDPEITSNRITKDTIGSLVDMSISYLQALPVARCQEQYFWSTTSTSIKDFLVVPDGSNTLGGLYRTINQVLEKQCWTCQQHGNQQLPSGTIEALVNFVQGCGGHVNIQRASLSIKLCSRRQAEQLCVLIINTRQRLDISIKLGWDVSRRDLEEFLSTIADTKLYSLELDGITHSMLPQGNAGYRIDPIAHHSIFFELPSVTLLNYPWPQERCIYLRTSYGSVYKLHLKQQQQVEIRPLTMELQIGLSTFETSIMANQGNDVIDAKSQRLWCLLAEAGYHAVSTISSYHYNWHGEFNMKEGALRELQLNEFWRDYPFVAQEAMEYLHTLALKIDDLVIHREETAQMLQASLQLQELVISLQENHTLESIEKTVEMWQGRSSPLQLTLVEFDHDDRGRVVAQAVVSSHVSSHPEKCNPDLQGSNAGFGTAEFLQWKSDHVLAPLTDLTAALLDTATKQHPSVLTSFTLDISNLSREKGLPHLQNIFQQSTLGLLHICCTTFNASLSDFVRQVLLSIQWPTLQSLILSGAAVNVWIRALAAITDTSLLDLQLQCFRIQGTGRQAIILSHASVLFVHQLLYLNPLMELVMENVCLQDEKDSEFCNRENVCWQDERDSDVCCKVPVLLKGRACFCVCL